jgi:REP element-mobilizing transposase RayT
MYEYRRMLPHYQKAGRALFVTFCKSHRNPFSAEARDLVLRSCVHDHGQRYQLHAAVVMPEHVHLLLTPLVDEKGWPYGLPAILKLIKGVSARATNKLSGSSGPVWQEESFDHVLRSQESFEDKLEYIRQNPVRPGRKPGRISLALGRALPVWVGHSCPTKLTLILICICRRIEVSGVRRQTSKASFKSVRPTRAVLLSGVSSHFLLF